MASSSIIVHRLFWTSLLVLIAACSSLLAQDTYVASWTIQDPAHDLRQDIAEQIIERANIWLTRDNPEAGTVRLDDKLRVTVVGEYNQKNGKTEEKLVRVNIGGLILEEDVRNFLDNELTEKILLRHYYWRDENLNVLDPALAPSHRRIELIDPDNEGQSSVEKAFSTSVPRNPVLSLSMSVLPLSTFIPDVDEVGIFAGLGHETSGFPGLSYQRMRAGILTNGISAWYEAPLNLSIASTITGTNEAAPGAGLAFDVGMFGGSLTWSDPYSISSLDSDTGSMQSKQALLYGIIPLSYISGLNGWLRVKAGAGYIQGTTLVHDTSGSVQPDRTFDMARVFLRGEFATTDSEGNVRTKASVGAFGTGINGSLYQRFGRNFGIEANVAINGIFGTQAPFLPQSTVWITPVWILR